MLCRSLTSGWPTAVGSWLGTLFHCAAPVEPSIWSELPANTELTPVENCAIVTHFASCVQHMLSQFPV